VVNELICGIGCKTVQVHPVKDALQVEGCNILEDIVFMARSNPWAVTFERVTSP